MVSIHARHYWRARPALLGRKALPALFQSTPAITGGRDHPCARREVASAGVSIHARHYWRARPLQLQLLDKIGHVSIHARHYWRARRPTGATPAPRRSFNPRPPLLAGETVRGHSSGRFWRSFNPRPPLLAGETSPPPTCRRQMRRFNPRPPLLAGETALVRSIDATAAFQSTPAITGGRDLPHVPICSDALWFQSTPAITGGRDEGGRCTHR